MGESDQFHAPAALSSEKETWVGPRTGFDAVAKRKLLTITVFMNFVHRLIF